MKQMWVSDEIETKFRGDVLGAPPNACASGRPRARAIPKHRLGTFAEVRQRGFDDDLTETRGKHHAFQMSRVTETGAAFGVVCTRWPSGATQSVKTMPDQTVWSE